MFNRDGYRGGSPRAVLKADHGKKADHGNRKSKGASVLTRLHALPALSLYLDTCRAAGALHAEWSEKVVLVSATTRWKQLVARMRFKALQQRTPTQTTGYVASVHRDSVRICTGGVVSGSSRGGVSSPASIPTTMKMLSSRES